MNLHCVEICVIMFHSSSCISFLHVVFVMVLLVLTSGFEPIVCTPTGIWLHPVCSKQIAHFTRKALCSCVFSPRRCIYFKYMWRQPYHLPIYLYTRHDVSIKLCSVFQFVHLDFTLTWLFPLLGEVMFHVSMPPPLSGLRETQSIHRHGLHTLIKPSHERPSHWIILWDKWENLQHFCVNLDCEPKQIDANIAWNPVLFGKFVSNDICIFFGHVSLTR